METPPLETRPFEPQPLVLKPGVQHYAWGDPDFIPRILGAANPERRPHAELWIGAHPSLPSQACVAGREVPLDRLIAERPEAILGRELAARFGRLPFLFKVLTAAKPLSIQVHPDSEQAREGFARESSAGIPLDAPHRNYRDHSHKPELIVALTDLYALCGFRPLDEIARVLRSAPELLEFHERYEPTPAGLRRLYEELMFLAEEKVDTILGQLVKRLGDERRAAERRRAPFMPDDRRHWILAADEELRREGHHDRGLLSILLLNLIHLRPGQGLYLPAGVLHAYLRGAGVEVMASSDNVLRGGLTTKHVDVKELLRIVRFDAEQPRAFEPEPTDPEPTGPEPTDPEPAGPGPRGREPRGHEPTEPEKMEPKAIRPEPAGPTGMGPKAMSPPAKDWVYRTPAEEFELRRISIGPSRLDRRGPTRGPAVILVAALEAGATVSVASKSTRLELSRGAACLIPDGLVYELSATGPAVIYKVGVGAQGSARGPAQASAEAASMQAASTQASAQAASTQQSTQASTPAASTQASAQPALTQASAPASTSKAVPRPAGEEMASGNRLPEPEFRGRKPTRLAFGTSGLRGLVTDITDLEAYVNTRGFLDYLVAAEDLGKGGSVAVAGDLRPSTDGAERSILRAVARAILDAGFAVENAGRIPTPALACWALQRRCPSIMVTGSHIPFDRNGIKFNRSGGEVLKSDEAGILAAVEAVRRAEYVRPATESQFGDDGMLRSEAPHVESRHDEVLRGALPRGALLPGAASVPLPPALGDARDAYVRRYLGFFPPGALSGKRIVVYQHSAVGRDILAEILVSLGAAVVPMGRSDEFVAIDTEAVSDELLGRLQAMADEARRASGPIDAIVSTDGDSDRPLVAGIDAGKVRFFGGDLLGIVVADYLGADSIAVPVSASDAVDLYFAPRGVATFRTKIGSPYVIAAMERAPGRRRVAWESNGGFLTGSDIEKDGRVLRALPTRDAMLPILAALHAAFAQGLSLVDLFATLPRRFSRAGLIDSFSPEASGAMLSRLSPRDDRVAEVRFGVGIEGGTGGRRGGVTCVSAKGEDLEEVLDSPAELKAIRSRLETHFSAARGFGDVVGVNYIDGVRIYFSTGDIAHLRPSGNAPQLRIYAVSGDAGRADAIVRMGIREPDGILRELAREVGS